MNGLEISCLANLGIDLLITMFVMRGMPFPEGTKWYQKTLSLAFMTFFAGAWTERFSDDATRAAETIMAWVAQGKLRPRIDRVLPLEQAADAMSAISGA